MLQNLSIQDFILIERLDLDFEEGFCVITGQTGAGKSILLDAILFALGSKANGEVVREHQEKAIVTLTFSALPEICQYLSNNDLELDAGEELIIKRIQYANGRKKFFINDHLVTQKIVFELFNHLLEINGQHNHTLILNRSSHLKILDQFANNSVLKNDVANFYKIWKDLEKEANFISLERENIIKEIDYLTHICEEFDKLNLKEFEEEELSEIKKRLQTSDKEFKLIEAILSDIKGSNFEQTIAKAQRSIGKSENANIYDKVVTYLEEIYNKLEETKSVLADILNSFDSSEYSLSDIEDRLYMIKSLARKHGCHTSELGEFIQNSREQLTSLKSKLELSMNLKDKTFKAKEEYLVQAKLLSQNRQVAAKELEEKTMKELAMLEMKNAVFAVEIKQGEDFATFKGIDEVRFLASTNPGTPKAPIDKIASGGELSRFMLGFRGAFFDKSIKQTIIFDEIDVGISGSVADSIGQRLKVLSKFAQVIVITHQPQVAGKADQHILVQKQQTSSTTKVTVKNLDLEGRKLEVARMISGKEITENALAAAKELIC